MTEALFRDDAYLRECEATVQRIDSQGVVLDRSVFYPLGGGQPGDTGELITSDGVAIPVHDTIRSRETGDHYHVIDTTIDDVAGQTDAGATVSMTDTAHPPLAVGDHVTLRLDWPRRHRLMRFHTALHLLCSLIDSPVTSGSIQVDRARLDFDLPESPDKAALTDQLNALIQRDVALSTSYITDAELDAQPELVRTMSVQPPRNATGTIRLVSIDGIDLQPCGGTHVATTAEIGSVRVQKIEKKGRQNRRISIVFDDQ